MNKPRAKKYFGQNFLVDRNMQDKIVRLANLKGHETVLEIGPGTGALTRHLIKQAKQVIAYEIDRDLIPHLEEEFGPQGLVLIAEDVLKRDIDEDLLTIDPTLEEAIVVANLPYYITTPILFKLLETSHIVQTIIVMVQHEVAMRLTAPTKTKDYNALSVAVQYRAHTEYSFKVPRGVFQPVPGVDSAMVTLSLKKDRALSLEEEPLFFDLIKQAFAQRRKTLTNNLTQMYPFEKQEFFDFFDSRGLPHDVRAEALKVEDFVELCRYLGQRWP